MPGISVITNFDTNGTFPLDPRIVATNSTMRDSITYKYEGLKVYVEQDQKTYTWNGTSWTQDSNGIYGGSGSLVGNTVVSTGGIGTYSGSQSYTISFSSQTDVSGSTVDSTSIFRRFAVGTNMEFTRNFSQKTGLGSITNLSSQTFISTPNDVNFKVENFVRFGLDSSGVRLYNQNSGTWSASITFSPSFTSNATYSLPRISGTFAMTNQLSTNTDNLQQVTTRGNTTSRPISINVLGVAPTLTNSINLRPVGNSTTDFTFTTFWYANYTTNGPGSYLGIKSSGNSIPISTPGGDGTTNEMRRLIRMFSGTPSNYNTANINATNGFLFSWRPLGFPSDNSLYLGSVTISSDREIYFPNKSGDVDLLSPGVSEQPNQVFVNIGKVYDVDTVSQNILAIGSGSDNIQTNPIYSGAAGSYVQWTDFAQTKVQYIQLPTPVGRGGDIISFCHYNWNNSVNQFDVQPIYMTGSSGFSITGGQAFWDYQIGPTGGYTNSWYGGRSGSLISDGTKWIKWNYDYTRLDQFFGNQYFGGPFLNITEQGYKGVGIPSSNGYYRSTIGKKSGKWYWETRINLENGMTNFSKIGIVTQPGSLIVGEVGTIPNGIGIIGNNTIIGKYNIGTGLQSITLPTTLAEVIAPIPTTITPFNSGEVLGHALDLDSPTRTYTVYRGGTTDPTNVYIRINITGVASSQIWYPAVCSDGTTNSVDINFGQFGFSYSVPIGFNRGIFFKGWDDSNITRTNQGIGW